MKKYIVTLLLLIISTSTFSQKLRHDHNILVWYSQHESITVEYAKTIDYDGWDKLVYGAYIGIGAYLDGMPKITLGLDKISYKYNKLNYRVSTGIVLADFKYIDLQLGAGLTMGHFGVNARFNMLNTILGWGRDYDKWEIGLGYRF